MSKFVFIRLAIPTRKADATDALIQAQKAAGLILDAAKCSRTSLKDAVAAHNAINFPSWMNVEKLSDKLAEAPVRGLVQKQRATADLADAAITMRHRIASYIEIYDLLGGILQNLIDRKIKWFESNGFNALALALPKDVFNLLVDEIQGLFLSALDVAVSRVKRPDGVTAANLRDLTMVINSVKSLVYREKAPSKTITVPALTSAKAREEYAKTLIRSAASTGTTLKKHLASMK